MKKLTGLAAAAAALMIFACGSFAASPNTYEVTGPILEVNDAFIAVQKGKERWEIARDAALKTNAELKVGDKVTITYTMKATKVEVKSVGTSGDGGKADAKVSATPATSPAKK
jgi:ribosomal 50S subunit-recycling heat shock protein